MPNVTVPVKSAGKSKINWTQIGPIVFNLLTLFGVQLSSGDQSTLIAAVNIVGNIATVIFRTWWNNTATK